MVGYVNSNYTGDLDKRRSLIRYLFVFGGGLVSWKENLQNMVALSLTKVGYIATIESVKETLWLKGIVTKLGYK